jgi:hypothetical protein
MDQSVLQSLLFIIYRHIGSAGWKCLLGKYSYNPVQITNIALFNIVWTILEVQNYFLLTLLILLQLIKVFSIKVLIFFQGGISIRMSYIKGLTAGVLSIRPIKYTRRRVIIIKSSDSPEGQLVEHGGSGVLYWNNT